MPWLADRFTLPLRSESWTLAQMELPSQVSNTLWGHRVAKSAKVCKAASNQNLKRFYPDLSRAVRCSPFSKSTTAWQLSSISSLSVKGTPAAQEKNGGPSTCLEARSPRQSLQLFLLLHAYFRWISGSVSVQFYWHLMLYIRCTRSCLTATCHSSPPWPVPES